jgi:hypothetical protein
MATLVRGVGMVVGTLCGTRAAIDVHPEMLGDGDWLSASFYLNRVIRRDSLGTDLSF